MRRLFCSLLVVGILVGCKSVPPPEPVAPRHIKPQTDYTPELWVLGGMGSYEKNPNEMYIAKTLQEKIIGIRCDVCVPSETREFGPNSILRNLFNTPKWLDADAEQQAIWALKMFVNPKRDRGHFIRKGKITRIRAILVAPCTQTLPPKTTPGVDMKVLIYRDPKDSIPNQELGAPNSMEYFSEFGDLKILDTRPDTVPDLLGRLKPGGVQGHHHFTGYWYHDLPILEQVSRQWQPSGKQEDSVGRLEKWLHSADVDYIFIGHSQGANMIMKILHIGCDTGDKKNAKKP
ncbi:MAG: hypothetical protein K8S55_01940 [Phycisphaerae bacterium]|nr:hypothetical protein [Phycisphaerae bacterium]